MIHPQQLIDRYIALNAFWEQAILELKAYCVFDEIIGDKLSWIHVKGTGWTIAITGQDKSILSCQVRDRMEYIEEIPKLDKHVQEAMEGMLTDLDAAIHKIKCVLGPK